MVRPGAIFRRTQQSGGSYGIELRPAGEQILIEEAPLEQGPHPAQARVVVLDGPRQGRKEQLAIRYIESSHVPVLPEG